MITTITMSQITLFGSLYEYNIIINFGRFLILIRGVAVIIITNLKPSRAELL